MKLKLKRVTGISNPIWSIYEWRYFQQNNWNEILVIYTNLWCEREREREQKTKDWTKKKGHPRKNKYHVHSRTCDECKFLLYGLNKHTWFSWKEAETQNHLINIHTHTHFFRVWKSNFDKIKKRQWKIKTRLLCVGSKWFEVRKYFHNPFNRPKKLHAHLFSHATSTSFGILRKKRKKPSNGINIYYKVKLQIF